MPAKPATLTPQMMALFAQIIIAMIVLVGYIVLTLTDHDANALLGVLVGQGVGGTVQGVAAVKN